MAANKFATMLHKKTNKLTLILVYTFLEWLLIFFLLLNSLFSYLIIKFADYFGLKKPCLWCSRLDQFFEPSKFQNSHRSFMCETHAIEISKLGYCSNHRKLAEFQHMCENCWKKFVFFPWILQDKTEDFDLISKCSCCGVEKAPFLPDDFVVKPFRGDSDDTRTGNLILEDEIGDQFGEKQGIDEQEREREEKTEEKLSILDSSIESNEMVANETDKADFVMEKDELGEKDNASKTGEIQTQHIEFYIDQDACHLIPIEKDDLKKFSNPKEIEEDEDFVMEFDEQVEKQYELVLESKSSFEEKVPLLTILECEEEEEKTYEIDGFSGMLEDFKIEKCPKECLKSDEEEMELHNNQGIQMQMDETEADISIGTQIPDQETIEESPPLTIDDSKQDEENIEVEFRSIRVETSELEVSNHLLFGSETNEIEEKKFLLIEGRESSIEESIDGSVASDIEVGDGVVTLEKLKLALKAERKALNAVYAELEEERSASAVAANQTMAMINRLQEEKATMQMEALQYQRMMEEQSEYDQEALQLMNELIVKRDKERAELEKELELYRKKVEEYETREKLLMLKRRKECSTRSSTCGEESDGLSVDLNHENGFGSHRASSDTNTPVDSVLNLEDSLANFEEERLSILDQLKVLEEKLFTLSEPEEDEEKLESNTLHHENGNGYDDHIEVNGKQEKRLNGVKAKRLLPLFDDAIERENEEETAKSVTIEEEVEQVYERLQALEEDREFLKHCMTSLRKGDKGIQLVEEILQHLRDLRYVENRARTMENGLAYS